MGRPPKTIDAKLVEDLAGIGCSIAEIAVIAGCSRDTIERRFAANVVKGQEGAKVKLRRMQWQAAMKGNPTMLIWLGKQMLNQGERQLPPPEKPLEFGDIPTPNLVSAASKPN